MWRLTFKTQRKFFFGIFAILCKIPPLSHFCLLACLAATIFFQQIIMYKSADSNNNRSSGPVYVNPWMHEIYVYEMYFLISFELIPSRNVLHFECSVPYIHTQCSKCFSVSFFPSLCPFSWFQLALSALACANGNGLREHKSGIKMRTRARTSKKGKCQDFPGLI